MDIASITSGVTESTAVMGTAWKFTMARLDRLAETGVVQIAGSSAMLSVRPQNQVSEGRDSNFA